MSAMLQGNTVQKIDHEAIKLRQHGAWSSGDYAVVGTTLQIVGERLCEALDLRCNRRPVCSRASPLTSARLVHRQARRLTLGRTKSVVIPFR